MLELISTIAYVFGAGLLFYFVLSAISYCVNGIQKVFDHVSENRNKAATSSNSTINKLTSLNKQLQELEFQVMPSTLGNFDTGVIQSLIDNSIVGRYEYIESNEENGVYHVSISDPNYGIYNDNYSVNENNNITGIPDCVSRMLLEEFNSIAGRQAQSKDHSYLKDNKASAYTGVCLAAKKLVIKHNHLGDVKLDSGRTFKVSKNDLLIPIRDINSKFISYQAINAAGAKNIRVATSIKGAFFAVGNFPSNESEYVLCEDYLTASTLHRVTGKTILVCFDVQNMAEVARSILFKDGRSKLIFATAKDLMTKNQARIKSALKYSKQFGMPFVFPVFPEGKKYEQYKSWSELQRIYSDEEMKRMFDIQVKYYNDAGVDKAISQFVQKYNVAYS